MKKLFSAIAAAFFSVAAFAASIDAVEVDLTLLPSGAAKVTEAWKVNVTSGTEWYLPKYNLGDIVISDLTVQDEQGNFYINEGEWNSNRSLEQKAGRCGIIHKSDDAVEICWGLGSMGEHTYLVSYLMTNVVKSLQDYDMLHLQLISPGLSSKPEEVYVTIQAARAALTSENTRFWGFGFVGTSELSESRIVMKSTEKFSRNSSVIALVRFDKGMFSPTSTQDRPFQEVLDTAMEGADFGDGEEDEDDGAGTAIGVFFAMFLAMLGLGTYTEKRNKKQVLGMKEKDIDWSRNVPFNGDVLGSEYVLRRIGEDRRSNSFAGALILRMVYNGQLSVSKDPDDKVQLSFDDSKKGSLDKISLGLYEMMKKASGEDSILQDKEFSRWSRKHINEVNSWVMQVSGEGKENLMEKNYVSSNGKFSEKGQAGARDVIGFRKFLKDFTLIGERETIEVNLWQDYLVFGTLYGIADKVASQLKDIDPKMFEQTMNYDYPTMTQVIYMSSRLGHSITTAQANYGSKASGGFGGGTSFGGGGGFSGGGFGGGAR